MDQPVTRRELAQMVERLLAEVEAHAADYHHVTPLGLLERARGLLRRFPPRGRGDET